jgi:hypothetical protein
MEDNKTKQGESTPEEIIEANTFFAVQVNSGLKIVRHDMALKALEMARKSEREKVIKELEEALNVNIIDRPKDLQDQIQILAEERNGAKEELKDLRKVSEDRIKELQEENKKLVELVKEAWDACLDSVDYAQGESTEYAPTQEEWLKSKGIKIYIMEEIKTIEKIIREYVSKETDPFRFESAAKEVYRLMLEEKVKAYEEARIIVFRAANEMVAEANLYKKIQEINSEIEKIK